MMKYIGKIVFHSTEKHKMLKMLTSDCLVTHILQNILCSAQQRDYTGLGQHVSSVNNDRNYILG